MNSPDVSAGNEIYFSDLKIPLTRKLRGIERAFIKLDQVLKPDLSLSTAIDGTTQIAVSESDDTQKILALERACYN